MAKLPAADWLALAEARRLALRAFPDHDPEEVAAALRSALADGKIAVLARCRAWHQHDARVKVSRGVWQAGEVNMQWGADRFVIARARDGFIFADVIVCRADLERWLPPFAEAGEGPTEDKAPSTRNKPGPRPQIRTDTADRMVADYTNNPKGLAREKQEVLASTYGVSRDTAEKARTIALSRLGEPRHNSGRTPA